MIFIPMFLLKIVKYNSLFHFFMLAIVILRTFYSQQAHKHNSFWFFLFDINFQLSQLIGPLGKMCLNFSSRLEPLMRSTRGQNVCVNLGRSSSRVEGMV
jgi:hypothetical protein